MSEAKATAPLSSRNPAGAFRHPALAVRRDVRGAVPDPGLRLRQRRAVRGALQGRGSRLPLFALLQPDRRDVRAAHDRARRRRGRARDRDRHGRGDDRDPGAAEGRRPCGGGEGDVRLLPLRGRGSAAALRHRSRRWSTASISTSGAKAMRPNTKTCFLESPTNPTLDVLDIAAIAEIAHQAGARLIVDNVFATPIWQSPLTLGADVVVYSATKHIDGQGRCLGGIILASEAFIAEHIHNFMRQTGPSMSPFNAWVLLKGLETLAVRVRAQTETAAKIADALAGASEDLAADLSRPRRSSAGGAGEEADARRLDPDRLRGQGRQAGRVPLPQRAADLADLQQSRRRQEPRHPSGDHDASAADAGGARRTRHQRGLHSLLRRAGACG